MSVQDPKVDAVIFVVSVTLAGLAAHLSEIWPAAELEPEHQGAVGHSVHIFTLCSGDKPRELHLHQCIGLHQCNHISSTNPDILNPKLTHSICDIFNPKAVGIFLFQFFSTLFC